VDAFKLKWEDIQRALAGEIPAFPKYTTQILNLANQNAQGTRPRVVGQMSDLITQFDGSSYHEWSDWYESRKPAAIDDATSKVMSMVLKIREAADQIDEAMVREWIRDLVLTKTFTGFRFQQAILEELGARLNLPVRIADAREESRGIDGYIGDTPVSVKPSTYKQKSSLSETIEVPIIYYEKTKTGVKVDPSEL
tara:strand:+ start:4422 stop:5006 length:585 start_codon:yes stop_codon:yes gene_type:complete